MASDRSTLAFERLDEVAGEDRRPADAPACDLAELASALAQVEALITAGANEPADAAAALERIADIAFVLHEREVEPSLCDALDAAMREISEVNARSCANVQRAHEAVQLLRALAHRLDALIEAQTQTARSAAGGELECSDEFPAPVRLFDADIPEDGAFAQAVAALAQSLPERSVAAPAESQELADSGAAPQASAHFDVEHAQPERSADTSVQAEQPGSDAEADRAPRDAAAATSAALPPPDAAPCASSASSADAALPVVQAIDPHEDPGDLFEPMPAIPPADSAAPVLAATANRSQETAPAVNLAPQSPHGPADAPAYAVSPPAAHDPLAPIRALSEEELIALFS